MSLPFINQKLRKPPANTRIDWSRSLTNGLQGAWLLNEGPSGVGGTIRDLGPQGAHGTLAGTVAWVNTNEGYGLDCTACSAPSLAYNGGVAQGNNQGLNAYDRLTYMCRITRTGAGNFECVFGGCTSASSISTLRLENSNKVSLTKAGVSNLVICNTALTLNVPTTVVATYDGATAKLFLNGVLDNTAAASDTFLSRAGWELGGNHGTEFFPGIFYWGYAWNRCLTDAEVLQISLAPFSIISAQGGYFTASAAPPPSTIPVLRNSYARRRA